MSRTKKTFIRKAKPWMANAKKMKPYLADKDKGAWKYRAVKSEYADGFTKGITQSEKLNVKNANRSRKKAMRQQSKQLIQEELNG